LIVEEARVIPPSLLENWRKKIAESDHPRELAVDLMYALQLHEGYLSDQALVKASELLAMTPLELEELATFYDFIYREPVGRFVIHVCDGVVCWMFGEETLMEYLCGRLGVKPGEMTADGLFTVLPTACIGFCDRAPAMLINGVRKNLRRSLFDETHVRVGSASELSARQARHLR
jgi:NADH-quinone oxidoreductase subunit E